VKKLTAYLLITFAILISGCQAENNEPEVNEPVDELAEYKVAISSILETKLKALNEGDFDLYMSTITGEDTYYYNEQKRWYDEMMTPDITNITLELEELVLNSETELIATIHQTHSYTEEFDFSYEIVYKLESGEWKDCGYNFRVSERDGYTVMYQEDETRISQFISLFGKAHIVINNSFEEGIDENFKLKLYTDRELFRQRTMPSMTWLFTGWGEANESLKVWTGHDFIDPYYGTFLHELVHHVTMKMCNNNLPGWMADGLALSYGSYVDVGANSIESGDQSVDEVKVTIEWLETADMLTEDDRTVIDLWYNASGMFVEFLRAEYGEDMINDMLYLAGEKPYNDRSENPNFETDNAETQAEVFEAIYGKTKEELQEEYYNWLDVTYGE